MKITVIMGIYNCAATLPDAIDCILAQTLSDWELILCDDGSGDNTFTVAERYQKDYPDQIILLRNEKNLGLNATLNQCLQYAQGSYIARMDGDDLCEPDRFEKEAAVLDAEPDIAIVSSDMSFFDEEGTWGQIAHPDYPEKKDFVHGSPFCHAACMVRREAYEAVGGYSEDARFLRVEDYHLWYKMYMAGFQGKNIHETLYHMRDDRNAYRRRKFKYRWNEAYVKLLVVKGFHLPIWNCVHALKPIAVGLMPGFVYHFLHRKKLKNRR